MKTNVKKKNLFLAESREKEESCVSQPRRVISHKTAQSAVLPCIVSNCSGENLHYQWFVVRENHHFRVDLTQRHRLDAASLQISSLNTNDSGVYYCAVNSTSGKECCRHHVGLGTTLVVRGKEVVDVDSRAEEYPTLNFLEQDLFSFRVYETRSETGPSVAVLHPLGHL